MGQFVGEQPSAVGRRRRKCTGAEHDILAHGIGAGADRAGRLFSQGAAMHPHTGKDCSETRSKKIQGFGVERTAGRAERFVNHGGRLAAISTVRSGGFSLPAVLAPASRARPTRTRRGGDGYRGLGVRCPDRLIGDPVGFMFQRIIDGTDFEVRLNGIGERHRKQRRPLKPLHTTGRKKRNLAEIPRRHCLPAGQGCGTILIFLRARLVPGRVGALRQKPQHRLIADWPPGQLPPRGRSLARPL